MGLKSKIILIYGPTASGKSNFAIKLAKKIRGEIVNADSMQVYKELKILSARPSPKNFQKIKHHLYGFQNAKNNFSTGEWLKLAVKKIKEVRKRKKIPIFVGGTGLYFKALIDGLVAIPNIPTRFRNKIRALHKSLGQKKFYKKLLKIDPESKNKINETDIQRTIRSYEVKSFTKKSLHQWIKSSHVYRTNYMNGQINQTKNGKIHSGRVGILSNDHTDNNENDHICNEGNQFPEFVHEMLDFRTDSSPSDSRHHDPQCDQSKYSGNMKEMFANEKYRVRGD